MAERLIRVDVTEQELDLLIAGVGELPTKLGYNLVSKLARIKNEPSVSNELVENKDQNSGL